MRTELTAADRDFLRITDNVYDPGDRDQSYAKAMLAVLYGDNEV